MGPQGPQTFASASSAGGCEEKALTPACTMAASKIASDSSKNGRRVIAQVYAPQV